jgi:hypothetical protein
MRRLSWQVLLGTALVVLSAIFYLIDYAIFREPRALFMHLIGDIAFVFIEVLLVTLIIHRLLNEREKRARLEKLNMVIGAFFSEVGTGLLTYLSDFDPRLEAIRGELIVTNNWSEREFSDVSRRLRAYDFSVDVKLVDLRDLRSFLVGKRDFLLRLVENPTLLEHETFTVLLRAVFHLTEELANREELTNLPDTDHAHLAGDIKRVYGQLVSEWLDYMKYLKGNYPFLFSFAMRTNPFDQSASPIVK